MDEFTLKKLEKFADSVEYSNPALFIVLASFISAAYAGREDEAAENAADFSQKMLESMIK